MKEVGNHPLIHLLTQSEVEEVEGFVGNFKVRMRQIPDMSIRTNAPAVKNVKRSVLSGSRVNSIWD